MSEKRDANDVAAEAGPQGLSHELTQMTEQAAPIAPAPPAAPPGQEPPAETGKDGDGKEGRPDYQALAVDYMHRRGYGDSGPDCRLRYRQEDYFAWDGKRYALLSGPYLLADVVKFMQDRPDTGHRISNNLTNSVLTNLKGRCVLKDEPPQPLWIEAGGELKPAPLAVSMNNGVLDLAAVLSGATCPLRAHTPRFFSVVTLPYDFNSEATCPKWQAFLAEVLPDEGKRELLQEWFGYCLTPDTSYQKFLMLVGDGANGKSVICAALRAVLGEDNVSAVPLQAFGAERNFQLEQTIGKLANIQGDLGAISLAEEGQLKQFIGGEPCDIDRKGRRSIKVTPTARLTFATNEPPRFKDRTNAIQRRMLYMSFDVQIPEERCKAGMDKPEYWLSELPGIFMWAVAGLKRLRNRGRFQEPPSCRREKEAFWYERCPEQSFLSQYVKSDLEGKVRSETLYERYCAWLEKNGHSSKERLTLPVFGRQVGKMFRQAKSKVKPCEDEPLKKARHWLGILLLNEGEIIDPDEDAPPVPPAVPNPPAPSRTPTQATEETESASHA